MHWKRPTISHRERLENLGWHSWFAWYPVCIDDNWHWLEYVERKCFWYQGYHSSYFRKEIR